GLAKFKAAVPGPALIGAVADAIGIGQRRAGAEAVIAGLGLQGQGFADLLRGPGHKGAAVAAVHHAVIAAQRIKRIADVIGRTRAIVLAERDAPGPTKAAV